MEVQTGSLLHADDVAERFGVHPVTVRRWERRGLLPAVRVGGIVRFRADDVERLLAAQPRREEQ